jgi:site-specific DNA-cytosine methylase
MQISPCWNQEKDLVGIPWMVAFVLPLKIKGFPESYILKDSQANQKKFIGNAIYPHVVKALADANARVLMTET